MLMFPFCSCRILIYSDYRWSFENFELFRCKRSAKLNFLWGRKANVFSSSIHILFSLIFKELEKNSMIMKFSESRFSFFKKNNQSHHNPPNKLWIVFSLDTRNCCHILVQPSEIVCFALKPLHSFIYLQKVFY